MDSVSPVFNVFAVAISASDSAFGLATNYLSFLQPNTSHLSAFVIPCTLLQEEQIIIEFLTIIEALWCFLFLFLFLLLLFFLFRSMHLSLLFIDPFRRYLLDSFLVFVELQFCPFPLLCDCDLI